MKKINEIIARLNDRKDSEKGFTLLELIIVVAVIGILTAIAIPTYGAIQANAKANAVEAAATNAYTVAAAEYLDNGAANVATEVAALSNDDIDVVLNAPTAGTLDEENIQVTATWGDDDTIVSVRGDNTK